MSVKFDSGGQRRKRGSGFAAAIGLCLAAVCLVTAATVINGRADKKSDDNDYMSDYISQESDSVWLGVEDTDGYEDIVIDTFTDEELSADNIEAGSDITSDAQDTEISAEQTEDVWAEIPDEPAVSADDMALTSENEQAVAVSAAISYRMPMSGEVIKQFSGDELVFCSTMGDWRVHHGADISGAPDSEVYACADGVVVDFSEDMLYGYTAIIEHDDGSMLYYCGLSSVPKVTAGLVVNAGDVIGYLGTVPSEAAEPPHLHLAMMKDGAFVDPIRTMGL